MTAGTVRFQYFEGGSPDAFLWCSCTGSPTRPSPGRAWPRISNLSKYRVVLPFIRGYGQTVVTQPDYVSGQSAALAHDLLTLTAALQMERFHVAAHDGGARTSYAAAVLAPERILTLTALASPYLSWRGGLLPPAQVHGYWYQLYFQVDAAHTMLAEHRRDFCRELWKVWCPTWRSRKPSLTGRRQLGTTRSLLKLFWTTTECRWGGAVGRPAYADAQAKLDGKRSRPFPCRPFLFKEMPTPVIWSAARTAQEAAFTHGYTAGHRSRCRPFPHREAPDAVAQALLRSFTETRLDPWPTVCPFMKFSRSNMPK